MTDSVLYGFWKLTAVGLSIALQTLDLVNLESSLEDYVQLSVMLKYNYRC